VNKRNFQNKLQRQQARVTEMRRESWAPELAGFALLTIAVLTSAGFIG
jgi:hypothetical protein